ncbi:hypothetical protein GALMADRAFT_99217 [Galerina marginata CBS 339.88]|uniref:Rhodopsin domain-containing protein n=1 Tax=Galerina marginata (strain CBS 339.88) TaxID=685588 RepID=A0A067T5B5_GALM3|nr:hypothetical protein GALMADRAFT_99217 [Galerina marginata CBS 339.88]
MPLPPQNHLAWKISITLVHFLSLSSTVVRIGHRLRTSRSWWDDYVVVLPWSLDVIYVISMWAKYKNHDISWYIPDPPGFVYSAWFECFLYFTEIWFSRISLALSVARIFLPGHRYRIWTFIFAAILFLLYLASLLITTFACSGSPWWNLDFSHCVTTASGADIGSIVGVTIDFAADAVLVVAPLLMFWKIDFPPRQRVLVLVLFSSSIITMIASALYCIIWYAASRFGADSRLLFTMMSHLQATLSLLVCNLLVVTMLIYRKLRGSEEILQARAARHLTDSEKRTTHETRRTAEDPGNYTTTAPSYTVIPISSASDSSGRQTSTLSSRPFSNASEAIASSYYSNSFLTDSTTQDSGRS